MTMVAVLLVPAVHLVLPSLNVLPETTWIPTKISGVELGGASLDGSAAENTMVGTEPDSEARIEDSAQQAAGQVHGSSSNAMIEAISFVATTLRSLSVAQLTLLVWLMGIAIISARFALARWSLRRLWLSATPAVENAWDDLIDEAGDRVFLTRAFQTREIAGIRSPMTWGILSPRLLLPVEARQWSQERKLNALMHEMVHIRRLDAVHDLLSAFVVALNWFNPLAWMMRSELKAQREASCDSEVLQLGAQPEEYARMLIDVAKDMRRHKSAPRLAMTISRPSQLEGRVLSVLNFTPGQQTPVHRWAVAGCMTFVVLFTAAAAPGTGDDATSQPQPFQQEIVARDSESGASDAQQQQPVVPQEIPETPEVPAPGAMVGMEGDSWSRDADREFDDPDKADTGFSISLDDVILNADSPNAEDAIGDLFAVAGIRLADAVLSELGRSVEQFDWEQLIEDADWNVSSDDWNLDNIDIDLNGDDADEVDAALGRFSSKMQNAIVQELEQIICDDPGSTKARRARKALLEIDSPASRAALSRLGIRKLDH
jgi:beta-lactamase regulating signal transducer with metallopeptidase domain